MKASCTHYQGQCDHLVCPRTVNDPPASGKCCINGWRYSDNKRAEICDCEKGRKIMAQFEGLA